MVRKEFDAGRYIGPFSKCELEDLLGPFQTSPLSLIPKPHSDTHELRIIQNFSFPRSLHHPHFAINYFISSDDFPCTWGTFNAMCLKIALLPPGSEGGIRDVSEAYRLVGTHHSQWPGTVVRIGDDQFAADTCVAFGETSGSGAYGVVADAGADIYRAEGIGPLSKWVDDHCFLRILLKFISEYNNLRDTYRKQIEAHGGMRQSGGRLWWQGDDLSNGRESEFDEDLRFPIRDLSRRSSRSSHDVQFTYNFMDINDISQKLGIPWKINKDVPFSTSFPFTGLTWDLQSREISLPAQKRHKYMASIKAWQEKPTHLLSEVQKLYGRLLHSSRVIPMGRAYLTSLETMLAICHDRPYLPHSPPRTTAADLAWWSLQLSKPLTRKIPAPCEVLDFAAYSDASSGVGIGITIGSHWRAWRLLPGWNSDKRRDIQWAEAVGFELLVRALLDAGMILTKCTTRTKDFSYLTLFGLTVGLHGQHAKTLGDNKSVIEGWWNGRSRHIEVNIIFRRLHNLLADAKATVHTRYIPSASNPADGPSRGIYPSRERLLPPIILPEDLQPFIIDFDAPLRTSELKHDYTPRPARLHSSANLSPTPPLQSFPWLETDFDY